MVFELTEPDDRGIRHFAMADLVGVAFDKDETGKTVGLRILETTPFQRASEQPDSVALDVRDEYLPYVGTYLLGPLRKEILVRVIDGKLAIDFADEGIVKLADPDGEGRWYFEGRSTASVTFPRDDSGRVLAMNLLQATKVRKGKCSACLVEKMMKDSGVEQAIQAYREIRANRADEYVLHERGLNAVGYRLLNENRVDDAIQVFKLNVDEYPDAFNVYDSLGEAYLKKGDKELARQNYEKSLELNPDNENARKMLGELEKGR